jgi:hypothetical protein
MANQPTARMIKLAREIGAIRNGKPDWYRVAEFFAPPEFLQGAPASRPVGRPKNEKPDDQSDEVLAIEINHLKWTKKFASVKKACEHLSESGFYERRYVTADVAKDSAGKPLFGPDGKGSVIQKTKTIKIANPWKGVPAATLKRRYQAWLKIEKQRQTEMSIAIPLE